MAPSVKRGLTALQKQAYPLIGQGLADQAIAAAFPTKEYRAVRQLVFRTLKKLNKKRIEVVLSYTAEQWANGQISAAEIERAVIFVAAMRASERKVFGAYLQQWQYYAAMRAQVKGLVSPRPADVALALGLTEGAVNTAVSRQRLRNNGTSNLPLFLRWLYIAQLSGTAHSVTHSRQNFTPTEHQAFELMGSGMWNFEIADALDIAEEIIAEILSAIQRKLNKTRMEIMLDYVDEHFGGPNLPFSHCHAVAHRIQQLTDGERAVLAAQLSLWQAYADDPERNESGMPTQQSVGAKLNISTAAVRSHMWRIADVLGHRHSSYLHWQRSVRDYYIAMLSLFTSSG